MLVNCIGTKNLNNYSGMSY